MKTKTPDQRRRSVLTQNGTGALRVLTAMLLIVLLAHCGEETKRQPTLQERYQLSDAEARLWDSLWVDEADSITSLLWGFVGRGEFDKASLLVERYDDKRMKQVFDERLINLWQRVYRWPAASFTEEPDIDLGPSETIGFRTWGELLSGGFQRAVLCDDSITVYFVFKGYWQAGRTPLYAAVGCGDFGKEQPNWRPFPTLVFSVDAAEETIIARGHPQVFTTLDGFLLYLRGRTFGSFGT